MTHYLQETKFHTSSKHRCVTVQNVTKHTIPVFLILKNETGNRKSLENYYKDMDDITKQGCKQYEFKLIQL